MAPRRALLALPALLLASTARAGQPVPPFPQWIGRTALLRAEGGSARLLLSADGTGQMALKLLLMCRGLPIRRWELAPGGRTLSYVRSAVLDSSRMVEGEARILPEPGQLLWIEARAHTAEFEGFAAPETAGRCS